MATIKVVSTKKIEQVVEVKKFVFELDAAQATRAYYLFGHSNGSKGHGVYEELVEHLEGVLPEDFQLYRADSFYQYEGTDNYRVLFKAFKKILGEV